MPAKIIIYILSYNTETYNISRSIYGQYKWARFVILPPTILFENYMYDEWLINNYDEWKDCDFVGTLAWKAIKKIKLPDIDKLADFLEKNNNFDIVPFYVIDDREYLDYVDICGMLIYAVSVHEYVVLSMNMLIYVYGYI